MDLDSAQSDLDALVNWSKTWYMDFNISKCSILKFKSGNIDLSQQLTMLDKDGNQAYLAESSAERNLGVIFDDKLKWNSHIQQIALKANYALGTLKRTFKKWNADMFLKLYTSFVRPLLDFCAPVWNQISKRHIKILKKVQRRATKLVPQYLNYESRFASL